MPLKNVLGNSCAFVSQHLGLRHRYMFTKKNRLRLRYVAGMTAAMAAGLPTAVAFAPLPNFPVQFEIATAAQAYNYVEPSAGQNNDEVVAQGDSSGLADLLSLASIPQFEKPAGPSERVVTISAGDALGVVMQKEGVGSEDVHNVIAAMKDHFDPRSLKAGQDVHMMFEPLKNERQGGYQLTDLKIQINPLKTVVVSRHGEEFESSLKEKEVKQIVEARKATIKTSLYGSAAKAGIPQSIVVEAIKIYSQNVDFQRDVQPGDSLEVMYDTYATEEGYIAKTGNVLYAKLTLGGRDIPLYRYELEDGSVDYFDDKGHSSKKTLMKTPINGARLSSGFGMRRHPVLGYGKMHKGIDFAAPTGTPIYAAGDGKVERAGRFSSYGNYVKIRHRSDLHTAYAHMSRISVKVGQRVKQGEVIGYVGTTGRSTGPHLHYEVLVNNKHTNPRSLKLPVGQVLAGRDLKRFKEVVQEVNNQYAAMARDTVKVAQNRVTDDNLN